MPTTAPEAAFLFTVRPAHRALRHCTRGWLLGRRGHGDDHTELRARRMARSFCDAVQARRGTDRLECREQLLEGDGELLRAGLRRRWLISELHSGARGRSDPLALRASVPAGVAQPMSAVRTDVIRALALRRRHAKAA